MIEFPKVQHRIPAPFVDKIEVDRAIAEAARGAVVAIDQYRKLVEERNHLRYSCSELVKRQRGGGLA